MPPQVTPYGGDETPFLSQLLAVQLGDEWSINDGPTRTNLINWFTSPTGAVTATNTTASWTDTGPPDTLWVPLTDAERFYRVFQYGTP